ncbi:hypothetical protein SDC9_105968 [bioreactor metagenome]|uniref:Uncharacterized protein n=1 Tax=bioreactor metagenome TaxID=1076179 RepID=A0A645B113_9ZZZZ
MPPHVPLHREQHDGRGVACQVHQLGRCRRVQKVITQQAHEHEDEEAARARAEEPVVGADGQTDGACNGDFPGAVIARRVVPAQILLG